MSGVDERGVAVDPADASEAGDGDGGGVAERGFGAGLRLCERVFDGAAVRWESWRARRVRAWVLAIVFFVGIVVIELGRRGAFAGSWLEDLLPGSHLAAITMAVTVLLLFEVVELMFALSRSVAGALAAQLDIYALILLRDAFLPLAEFGEPVSLEGRWVVFGAMVFDATGAVALFLLTTVYRRMQRHMPITGDQRSQRTFIRIKKLIGLTLIGALLGIVGADGFVVLSGGDAIAVFDVFFTVLIFADVLLAIVSLGFSERSSVVFRNFGFAFVAVILRLALAADDYVRPLLAVLAAGFAIGITFAYNRADALLAEEGELG